MSETIYDQLVHSNAVSCGLGRWKAPPGRLRRVFRNTVHLPILQLHTQQTRHVRGFLPRLTSQVSADVGTGSGILALAAARAGATVVALDINPQAVNAAIDNSRPMALATVSPRRART